VFSSLTISFRHLVYPDKHKMQQLLEEFQQISTTYPNIITKEPLERVEKAAKTNTYLKKDLVVTLYVPVGISHARLPPVAHLVCEIPPSYPIMLPKFSIQTVSFLTSDTEGSISAQLMQYISELYVAKQKNFIVSAVQWVHEIDFTDKLAKLHPRRSSANTFAREYFYFHHLWGKSKRFSILVWANELSLTGFIAPGRPGFLGMEGDVSDLRVLASRLKCVRWREMRFLASFASSPSASFSPLLPSPPFEFLHPKWVALEAQGNGLVESTVDKESFVEMLSKREIPKNEIDQLLKYLP
jgi:hypothetical protein